MFNIIRPTRCSSSLPFCQILFIEKKIYIYIFFIHIYIYIYIHIQLCFHGGIDWIGKGFQQDLGQTDLQRESLWDSEIGMVSRGQIDRAALQKKAKAIKPKEASEVVTVRNICLSSSGSTDQTRANARSYECAEFPFLIRDLIWQDFHRSLSGHEKPFSFT